MNDRFIKTPLLGICYGFHTLLLQVHAMMYLSISKSNGGDNKVKRIFGIQIKRFDNFFLKKIIFVFVKISTMFYLIMF
ncbi:hypothetical protein EBR77_03690 [bacterium]|nr:hypothetical protein [bacterium]